jgi:hypothetical protein
MAVSRVGIASQDCRGGCAGGLHDTSESLVAAYVGGRLFSPVRFAAPKLGFRWFFVGCRVDARAAVSQALSRELRAVGGRSLLGGNGGVQFAGRNQSCLCCSQTISNYVFKPTADPALRTIQSAARRRLNTALALKWNTLAEQVRENLFLR